MAVVRSGTLGRVTERVPARRRIGLHAGPDTTTAGQRVRRRLRLLTSVGRTTSSGSRSCAGPQSALFGSNAIGAVVRIITRDGGPLRGDAPLEGGSFDTSRVAASRRVTRRVVLGRGVERLARTTRNGQRTAAGDDRENDDYTRTETGASGGWRRRRRRGDCAAKSASSATTADFRDRIGSNPIGAFDGHRHGVERTRTSMDRLDWRHGADRAAGSHPRRLDVEHASTAISPARSALDLRLAAVGDPASSRTRTFATASISRLALEFLRERATSTFITDDSFPPIPVKRSVAGYFGEVRWSDERTAVRHGRPPRRRHHARCASWRGGPVQPAPAIRRRHASSRPTRGLRSPTTSGPTRPRRNEAARLGRHRHPSAGRLRDRVHRQPVAEAGTQPQRRRRRRSAARRRTRAACRRRSSTTATTI